MKIKRKRKKKNNKVKISKKREIDKKRKWMNLLRMIKRRGLGLNNEIN